MTENNSHYSNKQYECIDNDPYIIVGSAKITNGALFSYNSQSSLFFNTQENARQ